MILANIFTKKQPKVKQYINIKQTKHIIKLEGLLSSSIYDVRSLRFVLRNEVDNIHIPNQQTGNRFLFEIDLNDYIDYFNEQFGIYNIFINVRVNIADIPEQKLFELKTKPTTTIDEKNNAVEYPIRLGRFAETVTEEMEPVSIDNNTFHLYKTVKGSLSLSVNKPVEQKCAIQIDNVKSRKDTFFVKGKVFTRTFEIETADVLVAGRENNKEMSQPVQIDYLHDESIHKFGLNRYTYSAKLMLKELFQDPSTDSDVYDVYLRLKFLHQPEPTFIKIGKPRYKAKFRTKTTYSTKGETVFSVSPYYSFRFSNLCLHVEDFQKSDYAYLRRLMRFGFLLRPFYKGNDIWVIGELPYKGQDTGYHFFKYVRTHHPDKNAYYVIDKESPDLKNVEPFGNVVYFKSREHIKATFFSTKVIVSHHAYYIYPLRTKDFKKKMRAKVVFLQHGVLGTKNMTANYGKRAEGFETDLIVVSSELEKNIFTQDLGYDHNEVVVTGLSRFDSLLDNKCEGKRQLLIIPTWREWLLRQDIFLESEYFERYKELIFHPRLQQLASQYNFDIALCLHPNAQRFSHVFKEAPVRLINQGDVNVQDLLKESALMLTDYSSVAFDFSFLDKPIIYYQFDRRRFIGKAGSHLNLDRDLPGDIVFNVEDVLAGIEEYAQSDFQMKEANQLKAAKFIKYKDQHSSERIYQEVNKEIVGRSLKNRIIQMEIVKKIYNRFRKNKYYGKMMRGMYKCVKTFLPVDKRLIVFESGVGKQYTDSPRHLYEEIVRRNLPYKKVWIYNKQVRFSDAKNTKRIKRLSPMYYYYLARAGFWVNNQNFPTNISKPKKTTYIQTWHGTPLKKMLHDIEHVMGRGETYLDRVSKAISSWDYLISPSPYATARFRSAFQYKGEVIESGYPRNDIFYSPDQAGIANQIRGQLHIIDDKKVILYAPTFRDNETSKSNHFTFKLKMDLEQMKQELGDEYVVLLRMHVVIKNKVSIPEELKDFVLNVSSYPDVQELLTITDVLITDYSSLMFDFANTRRPILFFTYDLETYRDMVRGFYIDFEAEAPGPIVRDTEEIIHAVKNIHHVNAHFTEKYDAFVTKYCGLEDGRATERVVDFLQERDILK